MYNLMLDNGVDAERIEIIGLGAKSPWHEDEWDNDDFIENIAQENRAVLILERNSERAKMLLNESKSGYDS